MKKYYFNPVVQHVSPQDLSVTPGCWISLTVLSGFEAGDAVDSLGILPTSGMILSFLYVTIACCRLCDQRERASQLQLQL